MKKILALVVGAAALASIFGAQAQTLEKIRKDGAITLGYRDAASPFSFLDDKQQPIGYSMDICYKIVEAVKAELKMPALKVNLSPVGPSTRIPLIANGTIDLECGSTTNNAERQKQLAFSPTTFVAANRVLTKKSAGVEKLEDLKGKTLVSTSGSTNLKQVMDLNNAKGLGITVVGVQDHPEAFLMVETGRAAAYATDDILLYNMVANAKKPADYAVSSYALSAEFYGIMLRKNDPSFKKVVDSAVTGIMKSGEIRKIYAKWFNSPIPPKGINLNVPLSGPLENAFARPTDSADPKDYQ